MTFEEKKQRAELLTEQIKMIQTQLNRLCDEMTQERFWLKPGDVIVHTVQQRRSLLGKVHRRERYYMIVRTTAYREGYFRPDKAVVWVHPVCEQTGLVKRSTTAQLIHYQVDQIGRIGHVDEYQTTERINLEELDG